jgi:hypothetical protein
VNFEALDLSHMQTRVVGFLFDIMILNVLKPKTAKRHAPIADVAPASAGTRRNSSATQDGGTHSNGDRKKATVADKNVFQRSAFKLKAGEKSTTLPPHLAHCPRCAGDQEACMKFNIKGFCCQG